MNDPQMRKQLAPYLASRHPGALVWQEYGGLGVAIPDIAVFDAERFHAYEIKSDCDTLRRLPNQLQAYALLFHRITVVVGVTYRQLVEPLLPDWVGLIVMHPDYTTFVRPAEDNPASPTAGPALWIEEARQLCRQEGVTGYSKLRSYNMPAFLESQLPAQTIHTHALACLQKRCPYAVR